MTKAECDLIDRMSFSEFARLADHLVNVMERKIE